MKKLKTFLLTSAVVVMSACSFGKPADPQEVIKDMMTKMQELTASTFDLNADVDFNDPEMDSNLKAKITVSGKSEMQTGKAPSVSVDINASADTKEGGETMSGSAKFLVTITNGAFYFKLDDIKAPADIQKQIESFVNLYKGNWYKLPEELIPDDVKAQLNGTSSGSTADTEKKEQLKKLIREAQLFDVIEESKDDKDYIYKVNFNQANLKTLLQEIAKIEGQPLAEEDLAAMDEVFTLYKPELTLYINQDSHYLDKMLLKINTNENGMTLKIDLTTNISNHGQTQEITAPADAQDFNMMGLMGLGMMLEGSQGSSLNAGTGAEAIDYSEFDSMDMEELENMTQELENMPAIDATTLDIETPTE